MRPSALVAILFALLAAACGSEVDDSPSADAGADADADADADTDADADAGGDADADGDADPCAPAELPDDPTVVLTEHGPVRGVADGDALSFLGVPFAAPPVGALRWRAPEAPACWSEIRDAVALPPACPQNHHDQNDPNGAGQPRGEEDCLYLNVWRPSAPAERRPVLVFIHGGGHQQGSTSEEIGDGVRLYDGAGLAVRGDAIVVTIQYRLGPLGYLALPALADPDGHAGNWGLLDQIAALAWVSRNIERFGGDPDRVLVFGESAGGVSTCALLTSPLARGLFSRALIESGGCGAPTIAAREPETLDYVASVGCGDAADVVECLRGLSAEALVAPLGSVFESGVVVTAWGPVVDDWALPASPFDALAAGDLAPVPLVVGTNRDETAVTITAGSVAPADVEALLDRFDEPWRSELAALYPPGETRRDARESLIRATTDAQFICPARRIARLATIAGLAPVFRYSFEHAVSNARGLVVGAGHGVELAYLFGAVERTAGYEPTEDDRAIADAMQDAWTRFAATGDPNGGALPPWPAYAVETDPYWQIAPPAPVAAEGLRSEACDVWDDVAALNPG